MTAEKFILLRLYNVIFGRFDFGRKFLRKILEAVFIDKKNYQARYVPSSRYFNSGYFKKNGK